MIWRVATHSRNRASLHEIEALWSFVDLVDANDVLTAIEEAEGRANGSS